MTRSANPAHEDASTMYAIPALHAPALSADSVARLLVASFIASRVAARQDVPCAIVNGRAQSWRERLNRAAFASRSRVTFRAPELEARDATNARRVRCEVFQERAGIVGRATFNV
jgi:hypothetical protein